jgi:BolA protein
VINESYMHKVAPGSETHFRVVVVSEGFRDQNRVARHRMVHSVLAQELAQGVHALAVETYVAEQWRARQEKMQVSPPCLGGSTSEQ